VNLHANLNLTLQALIWPERKVDMSGRMPVGESPGMKCLGVKEKLSGLGMSGLRKNGSVECPDPSAGLQSLRATIMICAARINAHAAFKRLYYQISYS